MKSKLFIKHDVFTLDDDSIESLVDRYHEAGYGIWWAIVERLTISDTHALTIDELVRKIDKMLAVKEDSITEDVIRYCIELGLVSEKEGYVYNERVIRQCEAIDEKSRKNAENVQARWENDRKRRALETENTSVIRTYNERIEERNTSNYTDIDKEEDKDIDIDKDKENERKECADYVLETYRTYCNGKFNAVKSMSDVRKSHCHALVSKYGKDAIKEGFEKASKSPFLVGVNPTGWRATFDWLIWPNNFLKVLEGNYDDKTPVKQMPKSSVASKEDFVGQKNANGGFDL